MVNLKKTQKFKLKCDSCVCKMLDVISVEIMSISDVQIVWNNCIMLICSNLISGI